ncbi:MAG: PSD1 domain-containing protein [Planctomycetia bacterium]|nr:PSD1 domain-containing protein [Planctomycetia bacterium]
MYCHSTCRRFIGIALLLGLAVLAHVEAAPELPPAVRRTVDFQRDIFPLLTQRCFACHRGQNSKSGYRLDQQADILGETDGKALAKPGDSAGSRLIHLVAGQVPDKRMPARGPALTAEEVGLLRAWIDQGMKWDVSVLPLEAPQSDHWAFQPIQRPTPPVSDDSWGRNPVDAFIRAKQQTAGVQPASEAPRRVLIRRLYLDLIGLPPTPEENERALRDPSPDWYEQLVERLLASPHYGERWGRHWLDLARYADSEGYESDHPRHYAWRYRDYVVASFNSDKPYDRFLREQVAGDELTPYRDENLIATGFLASARLSSNEEDKPRQINDVLVDVVNATATTLLGVTFNCCQCHNHKFDPFTARDYYRFQGFFVRGAPNNLALQDPELWAAYEAAKPAEYDPAYRLKQTLFENARARLIADARQKLTAEQRAALEIPAERRTPEQEKLAREADLRFQFTPGRIEKGIPDEDRPLYTELTRKLTALEKKMPDKPQTWGFYSPVHNPNKVEVLPMKGFYPPPFVPAELAKAKPYLLVAGEVHQRGAELDVGWPALFGPAPPAVYEKPRTVLADWLASPKNPLTARVWVNRLWQYHFGRGIVPTPSDFGTRGTKPTHPELLDWLASELRDNGWSTKHLHRQIVGSATYRQAAQHHAGNAQRDPENLLWWRWPLRRLESEVIRDATLAVTGELDRDLGGPTQPEASSLRRTIYLTQRRNQAPQMQKLFDGPAGAAESCPKRHVSTVPLQALYLMNNQFSLDRAKALAARLEQQAGDDRDKQLEMAFQLLLGRAPDEAERTAALKFFEKYQPSPEAGSQSALVHFCQALLNVNEFVYIE